MRNVLALGAAVLFISSVGVAGAQERLPQSSSGSGFGVGTGVGDVSGNSGRTAAFDRTAFMDRLAQAETVFGRVLAVGAGVGNVVLGNFQNLRMGQDCL